MRDEMKWEIVRKAKDQYDSDEDEDSSQYPTPPSVPG